MELRRDRAIEQPGPHGHLHTASQPGHASQPREGACRALPPPRPPFFRACPSVPASAASPGFPHVWYSELTRPSLLPTAPPSLARTTAPRFPRCFLQLFCDRQFRTQPRNFCLPPARDLSFRTPPHRAEELLPHDEQQCFHQGPEDLRLTQIVNLVCVRCFDERHFCHVTLRSRRRSIFAMRSKNYLCAHLPDRLEAQKKDSAPVRNPAPPERCRLSVRIEM